MNQWAADHCHTLAGGRPILALDMYEHSYHIDHGAVRQGDGRHTWAAFAGSDEAAFVDGDFAMLENELQPVLRAMRQEGINIVAIHQHMSREQPRLFPALLGQGQSHRSRPIAEASLGRAGGGEVLKPARGPC